MRTFEMYSFGNFQVYSSVFLAVVTVLHNTPLGFLYLIKVCTCTCFFCPLAHQHPLFLKVSDQTSPLITYIKWQSPVPIFHLLPCFLFLWPLPLTTRWQNASIPWNSALGHLCLPHCYVLGTHGRASPPAGTQCTLVSNLPFTWITESCWAEL